MAGNGMGGRVWVEWKGVMECGAVKLPGGWAWKESDGIVWDDEKEWEEMKGDEMVLERAGLNGTERQGMEWAGAECTER